MITDNADVRLILLVFIGFFFNTVYEWVETVFGSSRWEVVSTAIAWMRRMMRWFLKIAFCI